MVGDGWGGSLGDDWAGLILREQAVANRREFSVKVMESFERRDRRWLTVACMAAVMIGLVFLGSGHEDEGGFILETQTVLWP